MTTDYIEQCSRTCSDKFHGDLVGNVDLRRALADVVIYTAEADRVKKLLFYGEDVAKGRLRYDPETISTDAHFAVFNLTQSDQPHAAERQRAELIIHAVLGAITEAAELAEGLLKALDGELDVINLIEEFGDFDWYKAMFCLAVGVEFNEPIERVLAKLRKRFPDKFTSEAANVRNLDAERIALEATNADPWEALKFIAQGGQVIESDLTCMTVEDINQSMTVDTDKRTIHIVEITDEEERNGDLFTEGS